MSASLPVIVPTQGRMTEPAWVSPSGYPLIGKDILELLSSSMYVNPLTIFREYLQNEADAIDEARRTGLIKAGQVGKVDIKVDHENRVICIRDNGTGLGSKEFVSRMLAFGNSRKRGSKARGFRGVGRLAGVGYARELIFRTRTAGDQNVTELRWDCRSLKMALREHQSKENIEELVRRIVSERTIRGNGFPTHFFEVELREIVRHGDDVLLNRSAIESYLAQVAPVPFAPSFKFAAQIQEKLSPHVELGNVHIYVNGSDTPLYRPHKNTFEVRKGISDQFTTVDFVELPGTDGKMAALGWILHHSYQGALPPSAAIKGLRLRRGNLQVGESNCLDDIFVEPRFNSCAVGEIHVLDPPITPHGRRDYFEHGVHFKNLKDQLAPHAEKLIRICRTSSIRRNWERRFDQLLASVTTLLGVLTQSAISETKKAEMENQIEERIANLDKIAVLQTLEATTSVQFKKEVQDARAKLNRLSGSGADHNKLAKLGRTERKMAKQIIDLIYTVSSDEATAKILVQRILRRL